MDSKDELLAKLRAIDAKPPAAEPKLKPVSPPPIPASEAGSGQGQQNPSGSPAETSHSEISTDEFLAQLAALDEATQPAPSPVTPKPKPRPAAKPPQPPSSPNAYAKTAPAKAPSQSAPPEASPAPARSQPARSPNIPNVIERLKQFTQAQLAAHAAENRAKAERQQKINRAQAWLDQLDPLSDDGFWFEQFAERYESRLEAALDFLDPKPSAE